MARIKPRFQGLLASTTIAFMLVSQTGVALPSQEWKPGVSSLEPDDFSVDVITEAPLVRRAGGESGAAHARYLRQMEVDALFEAGRLATTAQQGLDEGQLGGSEQSNHRISDGDIEPRHFQTSGYMNDFGDPRAVTGLGPHIIADGKRHAHPRHHHHRSHHPDDHSRGGHSEHWYKHHGLQKASHHRNHHHHHHGHHHHNRRRVKASGLSRLIQTRDSTNDDDGLVTLIAPPSTRPAVEQVNEAEGGEDVPHLEALDRVSKEKTERSATSQYEKGAPASSSQTSHDDGLGKRRASAGDESMDGVAGIIDLMEHSPDGEKLGGLSISSLPPNGTTSITASDAFVLLIDSTPNLIDQATFSMHTFEDQTILNHEESAASAIQELLVALEVSHTLNDTLPQRMCATFNPLELDVQVFGLALCMDQDSAINNRRMSQAFRYLPETGVLTPYYGAEGARGSVLAAVNQRIQAIDLGGEERRSGGPEWNGTGIYDMDPHSLALPLGWANSTTSGFDLDHTATLEGENSTYRSHPGLDPFSASYPSRTTETKLGSKTMAAAASTPMPLLSVNGTSVPNHPLIIGGPTGETAPTSNEGTPSGVIMVFRPNRESNSWRRTREDVDTPSERQKALKSYQDIGIARQSATRLDHWAAIDNVQPHASTKPSLKASNPGPRNTTGQELSNGASARKLGAPVGYWSDSGASGSDEVADDDQSDETNITADSDLDDDSPPPKPVLNVAYFGDSGRSAPVPPDQQADYARPILVADPLAKPHINLKQDLDQPKDHSAIDSSALPFYYRQKDHGLVPAVMAAMSKSQVGPLGIPIDASD